MDVKKLLGEFVIISTSELCTLSTDGDRGCTIDLEVLLPSIPSQSQKQKKGCLTPHPHQLLHPNQPHQRIWPFLLHKLDPSTPHHPSNLHPHRPLLRSRPRLDRTLRLAQQQLPQSNPTNPLLLPPRRPTRPKHLRRMGLSTRPLRKLDKRQSRFPDRSLPSNSRNLHLTRFRSI